MKSLRKPMKTVISLSIIALTGIHAVNAGSFSLYNESSGAAIGNYAAGIAAEAADASTGWYNPAGLALLHTRQSVFSGVGVFPVSRLSGTSTFSGPAGLPPAFSTFTQNFNHFNGADSAFVPAFHYALPLTDRVTAGLSLLAPFGLSTNWGERGPVRYAATFSELLTFNLAPELGALITDNFAVGAGLDLQYARVKFNRILGVPTLSTALGQQPEFLDSLSYNKGHSFGVGFHTGGMLLLNDNHSRIGLNYQSRMHHKFHGYSELTGRLAAPGLDLSSPLSVLTSGSGSSFRSDSLSSNDIDFPEIVTLSGYHDLNPKVALLASVVYTGWHVLKTIELDNVAAFSPGLGQVKVNSISTQNYRNTWRAAVGINYRINDKLMLRTGGGYDQTPTVDSDRDVRLPDSNRWALAVGAHYQIQSNMTLDLGYAHLFQVGSSEIDKTESTGATTYNVDARIKAKADLIGIQGQLLMDDPTMTTK